MVCPHAGLVECEAIGAIPENTTKPQLHVYGQCIQRYRCGLDQHQGTLMMLSLLMLLILSC